MAATKQSSTEAIKKLEEQITCPICLEHFTDPKLVPCSHSFCLKCLQRVPIELVNGSHYLPCPTCRLSCPVPDKGLASLPPSFVINNLIEVYGLMKKVSDHQHASCDNCDNNNADRYCKQCAMFYCQQCLHFHDKLKSNTSHHTISLDEVASSVHQLTQAKPDPTMNCTDHDKPLEIFCEECQQLICQHCTVKKHKDHDYDLVTDTYKQHKDAIVQCSLQPLNKEFDRLQEARLILVASKNEISQQVETTIEEIDHTITQIKNHLDDTGRKLKDDARLALRYKDSVLDQQIKEIDTAIDQVSEYRDHVDQCVEVGTPQQLLLTKPQITSHSQNVIKSAKNKTLKPLEQADIRLVKSDKINQIHNNIGTVEYTALRLARLKISCRHIPLIGRESTITISLSLPNGSPAPVPLSLITCRLTPPNNTCPIECVIKELSQLGQYTVVFTPAIRGLHQLHVTVNDNNIPGSPVNVPVSVPPEMRGTPVKTITGLNKPSGVAVTDDGLLVVSELGGHCIALFDREGKKIRSFGTRGEGMGQLQYPQGVAITSKGTILVTDTCNHHIQHFTIKGDCISRVGSHGNGPLQLYYPSGITINKTTEQVIVTEWGNHRVQVLQPDLTFSHIFGSRGSGKGQFSIPSDVTIDSQGFVYVTDQDNHHVQKFTPEGQFVSSFGTKGDEPGQLRRPTGITVDDNDLLYVKSNESGYITVYTTNGQYISRIKTTARDDNLLSGLTLDSNGNLYVCEYEESKVTVL